MWEGLVYSIANRSFIYFLSIFYWLCYYSCPIFSPLFSSTPNSPVRLGVPPAAQPPQVFSVRGLRLYFPVLDPGLCSLSCALVVPPGLSTCKWGTSLSASCCLAMSPICLVPVSTPPTGLDECFFFNSLVVGLPYHLIFCWFWLFFLNLLLSFFWLCEEAQCVYLRLHLDQKSDHSFLM